MERLRVAARALLRRFAGLKMGPGFSLTEAVKDYEAKFIQRALAAAEGSVSRAARKLGINRQRLTYLLETRHRNLLPARTPAKKRHRSIITKKKR